VALRTHGHELRVHQCNILYGDGAGRGRGGNGFVQRINRDIHAGRQLWLSGPPTPAPSPRGLQTWAARLLQANYVWTFTTVAPPLVVVSTIPVNTATGVPLTQVLSATFNETLSCATLASPAASFVLTGPGATAVAGAVSCAGPWHPSRLQPIWSSTPSIPPPSPPGLKIWPARRWAPITSGPSGRYLLRHRPPWISTVPINLSTGVPINQALSAAFSVAMNPGHHRRDNLYLGGAGRSCRYGSGHLCRSRFGSDFHAGGKPGAEHTLYGHITTGAEDLADVGLAANYVWNLYHRWRR